MDIDEMEVLANERLEPEGFDATYKCAYCDNFQSQLLKVPVSIPAYITTGYSRNYEGYVPICKTCLTKMIDRLDQNILGECFNRNCQAYHPAYVRNCIYGRTYIDKCRKKILKKDR